MKKVRLYKNITTDNIYTLEEVKAQYAEANGCELPIDDGTMESVIYENLACIGGNIQILNDDVLAWCNDYAEAVEADRFLCQAEIDESFRDLYIAIIENDADLITAIKDNLYNADEILNRLDAILKDIHG